MRRRFQLRLTAGRSPGGYTLIELATTLAVLLIVVGVMVSLARHVRDRSAEQMTRELLSALDSALSAYAAMGQGLPRVPPLDVGAGRTGDETALHASAVANNEAIVAALRAHRRAAQDFAQLPATLYNGTSLRDAWGRPIVYMPPDAPNLGLPPQRRPFFFSAGPDGQYGTVVDNLYSYEQESGQ